MMKYIDENKINELIGKAKEPAREELEAVLQKSLALQRLSLGEAAILLAASDPESIKMIFQSAARVKNAIYGKRVVLFAPLYISNICTNGCKYCTFKSDNKLISRQALSEKQIHDEVEWLLRRGHKRILLVAGQGPCAESNIDYYLKAVAAVYAVNVGPHRIKRVNINCAPLEIEEFRRLKQSGIGTYQLFQETYHDETYRMAHPWGPKSDPDNRLHAVERAFAAGIDDVGIGVLYGLYDYRFETLALLAHIEELERRFKIGPHTISVPRIEPAAGAELSQNIPYPLSDEEFKKVVAVLRLAVPYTGIILSTRETPRMRDELFNLGVSQISAESRTSCGGYAEEGRIQDIQTQFAVADHRSLDQVIGSLIDEGFIPSFCAACYRKQRTGEAFMQLAKPGTIKGKCSMNALITLKEYLDDFASSQVKAKGYRLIEKQKTGLSREEQNCLADFFKGIDSGQRDEYV